MKGKGKGKKRKEASRVFKKNKKTIYCHTLFCFKRSSTEVKQRMNECRYKLLIPFILSQLGEVGSLVFILTALLFFQPLFYHFNLVMKVDDSL